MKTKKATFTETNSTPALTNPGFKLPLVSLRNPATTAARTKFVSGPAMPTSAAPYSPNFTRLGLNGTGLAAKIGGKPKIIKTTGNNIVVTKSICFSGLSVNRPKSLAVVSPSQWAVKACMASWKLIEIKMDKMTTIISPALKLLNILISIAGVFGREQT